MKFSSGMRAKLLALTLTGVLATAAWAQAQLSLIVNGTVASREVRMIGGRPFVPLSVVAHAYNQTLVKRPGGYELIAAGGAGEVAANHTAKIGDELFTGQFRFQVTGIHEEHSYLTRYAQSHYTITPEQGETLYVVDCRLKNGTPTRQKMVLDHLGNGNTALTDDQEHAYAPISWHGNAFDGFDVHYDETSPTGAYILPGAALSFALVFSVPQGTHPKDLIYSILKYGDFKLDAPKQKTVDVRVSLTQ